jgi:hypothetical protein
MPAFASKFMSAATHWGDRFMVNGLLIDLQLLEEHVSVKFFISNIADAYRGWFVKPCKLIFAASGCKSANHAQRFEVAVAVRPIVTHDFKSAFFKSAAILIEGESRH